jgi:hypothetical protein
MAAGYRVSAAIKKEMFYTITVSFYTLEIRKKEFLLIGRSLANETDNQRD